MTNNFITSAKNNERDPNCLGFVSVVLLCEKAGKRMKSYGPTPLVEIAGRKLIDLQIESIRAVFRDFEIIIACGFESEKIIKYVRKNYSSISIRVVENQVYHHSNCCESLRLCINNISNDTILVMSGDLLFHPSSIKDMAKTKGCVLFQDGESSSNLEIGIISKEDEKLLSLHYGLSDKSWSEMCLLKGRETIEVLRGTISSIDYKNRLVFEALNSMADQRQGLVVVKNNGPKVIKINNIKTLREINNRK
jgi:NDP-sugar pyrophosphorylase family protein